MIRSFLPVGQGTFAVECFASGDKVVFDCGSSTDVSHVERQIRHTFERRDDIEAVFISHLHDDHVNGLEYLLSYCHVKRIYLPYLTPADLALTKLYAYAGGHPISGFTSRLMDDPVTVINETARRNDYYSPQIFRVLPTGEQQYGREGNDANRYSGDAVKSGVPLRHIVRSCEQHEWSFLPFNFCETDRMEQFIEHLEHAGISVEAIMHHPANWPWYKGKLAEAYQKVRGSLNTNSMVVFSGPDNSSNRRTFLYRPDMFENCYKYCKPPRFESGCLYMGDYDASGSRKWQQLKDRYRECWDRIGILQVPHHGSKYNWNSDMACGQFILVITSGFKNSYGHPHAQVLREILSVHLPLYWVTENAGCMANFVIE